jgi:hypothetical protein
MLEEQVAAAVEQLELQPCQLRRSSSRSAPSA